ncbi:7-carboxy-7-deazaguanine synthase QueE [bacterium TMED181]|nr:7-carboxy-7-deazaguanine synthase QueE [Planctomycetota bacterium]OUW45812.1 MAG: 7-carboxy-7-deazaguanine synthase QueE [bacterium TMED181]
MRVVEIYPSIQGESTRAGIPCVFIRLAGCPLRCRWCDTVYSFKGGDEMSLEEICNAAAAPGIGLVELTGGEPLAHAEAPELLKMLCDRFEEVLLETSGAYPVEDLDPRIGVIMDMKAPGSGEESRNLLKNIDHLKAGDELKLVLADREDYLWAKKLIESHPIEVPILFSPVHGELDAALLSEWILEDRLQVRLHLQQHKFIWDPQERGR